MTKRVVALAVSLMLLVGILGGCGNSNTSNTDTSAASSSTAEPAPAASTAEPQKEVKLSFVSWMTKGEDVPLLEDFMKENPNIKVENQALDGGQYDQLLKTRMMSGDAPDVFLYMQAQLDSFVQQGYLADLTGLTGVETQTKVPDVNNLFVRDGKLYGYVISGNYGPMWSWYNKKYFAEKGFTAPKTHEEFLALLDKIKADGKDPLIVGCKDSWSIEYLTWDVKSLNYAKWPGSNGMEMDVKLAKGEIKYSDMVKDPLQQLFDYSKKGYISKAGLTMKWEQAAQYLVDGKAGVFLNGPWVAGCDAVSKADASKFEIGLFALPYPVAADGKKHCPAGSDRLLGMSASTKNPEEAKKLAEYWMRPDVNAKYLERQTLTTLLPIEYKVAPVFEEYTKEIQDPIWKMEFFQGSKIPPAMNAWAPATLNIVSGSTVDAELKKLDAEFEKVRSQMKVDGIQ